MKKLIVLTALFVMVAGPAMATDFDSNTPLTATNKGGETVVILKASNNVNGTIKSSANQFAAVTKHLNGTRNFATSSTDTKIYWKAVAKANKGKTTLELTLSHSDTSDFSSWTAL